MAGSRPHGDTRGSADGKSCPCPRVFRRGGSLRVRGDRRYGQGKGRSLRPPASYATPTTSQKLLRVTTSQQLMRAEQTVNSALTPMQRDHRYRVNTTNRRYFPKRFQAKRKPVRV